MADNYNANSLGDQRVKSATFDTDTSSSSRNGISGAVNAQAALSGDSTPDNTVNTNFTGTGAAKTVNTPTNITGGGPSQGVTGLNNAVDNSAVNAMKFNPTNQPSTAPNTKVTTTPATATTTTPATPPAQPSTNVASPTSAPSPTTTTNPNQTTDSVIKFIPSKKQINEMTREELIQLRSFLIKHCYKEAVETYDIYNVKRFAKECFKTHNMIPVVLNQYYPDIISSDLNTVYSKFLELAETGNPETSLKSSVQTQLDYTMRLFSNSSDWVGIVMSKKLGEWSQFFKNTSIEDMTIGKFFMIASLCASIVYLVKKFFKSKSFLGIGDKYDFSDNTVRNYIISNLKDFREDVAGKLQEYMNKDIPTDILMINSIVLKAESISLGLLLSVAYQKLDDYNIPLNILVLTEICCAIVLLWDKLLGRVLKKSKTTSNLYDVISDKLTMSMHINPNNPTRDIFSKLNKYSGMIK